jgi:hypothetical protein
MFQKAGRPGWAAIVPIYNNWVFFELAGKPGWWSLLALPAAIPLLGFVVAAVYLVLAIIATFELARRFGKGAGFAVFMVFFPVIAYPILGFGDAKYTASPADNNGPKPAGSAPQEGQQAGQATQADKDDSASDTPATAPETPADPANTDKKPPQRPSGLVQ